MMRLTRDFFERDALTVARELVGTVLWRDTPEGMCAGRIIETEAYGGFRDPAAHSYRGKTERVSVLFREKGLAYLYLIYGMYACLNIAVGAPGEPDCVLIRALEPLTGLPLMTDRRHGQPQRNLCSGPGKLCQALALTRAQSGLDLTAPDSPLWLEPGDPLPVIATPRINIDYAGEAAAWPWRFVRT